ncbi:biotin carboxylase N-terminal domain-containing protein [Streptomyces sp. NPDC048845]|uniref:acetyl/propionyl/methylcrotonyl-CoA carboxylase subunit alpha n=1 Tax=Streptomyces sp. NPDC048845 TaxID=3155390 RepID=UPI00343B650E
MLHTLLVANRGEIACRVFRTCRELGISTVAVHSDADTDALHTREADTAVRLPGDAPADTYLRGDLLVKAALTAGADAIHPGYGFLSENAGFARAVLGAGLTWIGPSPEAIEAMASKTRAKDLMSRAGVPLLRPLDPDRVTEADLPLLLKAAAGGGGRGMRIVHDLRELPAELAAARAEAASAFGDEEIFAEPYVRDGRHIEVQVLADTHGTVWALGTRDCSLQRRHQKVVEEAPANLPGPLRDTLHRAAADAARAIDYTGAGTVEFLLTPDDRAYFLEMNTRLQVEHPVTEEIYGLDLVALQIRTAEGRALPPRPPEPSGHAIEARLYAEDPARDWQPQSGRLHALDVPGVRLDTGFAPGDDIGIHYDPLLAKAVVHAPTRAEAARRLAHALARARVHGPVTNRDLLVRTLRHPDFAAPDTGFYDRNLPELVSPPADEPLAALAAALADAADARHPLGAWRNVRSAPRIRAYRSRHTDHEVRYALTRDGLHAPDHPGVHLVAAHPDHVVLETNGLRRTFTAARHGPHRYVDSPGSAHTFTALPRFPDPSAGTEPGSLVAPMPGTVVRVAEVSPGDEVTAGQPLVWLEAMKMEHRVTAPASGTLTTLHATPGQQIESGTVLAVVTPPADEHPP